MSRQVRTPILFAVLTVVLLNAPAPAAKAESGSANKPLRVYVLAGQSNMQGSAHQSTCAALADDAQSAPLLKDILDTDGQPVVSEKGELVCTRHFPAMPIGLWNDSDGAKLRQSYFSLFPGVWAQGDYAEQLPHGAMMIHGRSDAVLNPGGVRIGTAEIYRQVEKITEVLDSVAIGQQWQDDVRVVLFVRLRDGVELDAGLEQRIRDVIRANTTPRHVPARIVAVTDIPRTISGKVVELAVRNVVHGEKVKNTDALANPQALEQFRDRVELRN